MATHLDNQTYMLSGLIGGKAYIGSKKIGKLADMVITEEGKVPEVAHVLISRPFGDKSLIVPWSKVAKLEANGTLTLDIDGPTAFEGEPSENQVCLRDHLLDKKVLDCDDAEVEIVYDIKLTMRHNRLFVTDVDCSRAGFLRRIGLKPIANLIQFLAASIKSDTIPWTYVQPLPSDMGRFKGDVKLNVLKDKLSEINPIDLADIIEELDHEERMAIFHQLDTEKASDTLEEIEPRVQRQLVASLPVQRVAELVNDMTPAQAADMLAALPATDVDEILAKIDISERGKIQLLLERHDDHVLGFATTHYITATPETKVSDIIRDFRTLASDADVARYIYITSPTEALIGVVDIKELLQAETTHTMGDIMSANVISLTNEDTVATAIKLFNRYSFSALPIVGGEDLLVGVISYRDVMLAQKLV